MIELVIHQAMTKLIQRAHRDIARAHQRTELAKQAAGLMI